MSSLVPKVAFLGLERFLCTSQRRFIQYFSSYCERALYCDQSNAKYNVLWPAKHLREGDFVVAVSQLGVPPSPSWRYFTTNVPLSQPWKLQFIPYSPDSTERAQSNYDCRGGQEKNFCTTDARHCSFRQNLLTYDVCILPVMVILTITRPITKWFLLFSN